MAELWVGQICNKEGVHENSLKVNDNCSLYQAGFSDVQEDNQMEYLVVSLFNQMVNPAIVSLHGSETSQMTTHSTNHSRASSDSFKEEASGDPFGFSHLLWVIFGEVVVGFPNELDGGARNLIFKGFRLEMTLVDFLGFC